MRGASEQHAPSDYYDRLAVNSTLGAVASAQRAIVEKIVSPADGETPGFEGWAMANRPAVERARKSIDEILDGGELTLAKLTVAVAQLRELAEL
jgi:glutamate dehydrogenase